MSGFASDGGQAFPVQASEVAGSLPEYGMSLRDYYVGQAIVGLLAGKLAVQPDQIAKMADDIAMAALSRRNAR